MSKTKVQWTAAQRFAFAADTGDLLVTAAAGSGKTAVLTERCVHLLADVRADVGQLLVLTFTEAAASEMKSRISQRLAELSQERPADDHLRRQLALIERGRISTIHSFCYALLREFFYRIGLDPAAQVLDEDEARLLRSGILTEVLEEAYAGRRLDPAAFRALAETLAGRYDDADLVYALTRTHNFLDALADRTNWLAHCQELAGTDPAQLMDSPLLRAQREALTAELADVAGQVAHALAIMRNLPDGDFYQDNARQMLDRIELLQQRLTTDPDGTLAILASRDKLIAKLRTRRHVDKDGTEPIKLLLDAANRTCAEVLPRYASSRTDAALQWHETAGKVRTLLDVHGEFQQRYRRAKETQKALDYSDLEHLALELLTEHPEVGTQLRERYRYVLIDEYQDISALQERLLSHLRAPGERGNIFAVGDVKQSIYGFRQARPEIFLGKLRSFAAINVSNCREGEVFTKPAHVNLQKNFRSRPEIVRAVNRIFDRCMTQDFGELDYATYGRLEATPEMYAPPDGSDKARRPDAPRIELHLCEQDVALQDVRDALGGRESKDDLNGRELDAGRREAMVVALRLRRMLGLDQPDRKPEFTVVDKDQHRPLQPGDCAVLLRSAQRVANAWVEVFEAMGIPTHAKRNIGYLEATEIRTMLALLRLLDNPQQDIELAAVLRSPIGQCSESQLATIRSARPRAPWRQAVGHYARQGTNPHLRKHLASLLEQLETWRTLARRHGAARLIWDIYQRTSLLAWVRGQPSGRQRYANLIGLHDRARQFDSFARQGLGRFVRFLERLEEEDSDFGPAPLLTEADNVVRIMTVHNSKGLEFPVVFAANLGRAFNLGDKSHSILLEDGPLPAGARYTDPLTRTKWPTLAHELLARQRRQRDLAEELRILYVALTRAREHLVLCGSGKLDDWRRQWQPWRQHSKALPRFALAQATCFAEWIGPALADHPDLQGFWDEPAVPHQDESCRFALELYSKQRMAQLLAGNDLRHHRPEAPRKAHECVAPTDQLDPAAQQVADRLAWRYPFEPLTSLPARLSVTELKRRFNGQPIEDEIQGLAAGLLPQFEATTGNALAGVFAARPAFLARQTGPDPLEKGTWTHLFLERVDLEGPLREANLRDQLAAMVGRGVFEPIQALHIDIQAIAAFFASQTGQTLVEARDRLQREWSFSLALPAALVCPNVMPGPGATQEKVLVRGIVDCLFATPQGIVVLDFKTDHVNRDTLAQRAQAYRTQMRVYQQAVETILARPVVRLELYFLAAGLGIAIEPDPSNQI